MYRLIAILLWTVSASTASAQVSFGLVCSSQSEPVPRLLAIRGSSITYFAYGQETWESLSLSAVDGDKISGGKTLYTSRDNYIFINRIDGSWRSKTDINFNNITATATGICVRKTLNEMGKVAADYLAQLNARRAF